MTFLPGQSLLQHLWEYPWNLPKVLESPKIVVISQKSWNLPKVLHTTPRTLTLPVWLVLISIVPAVSCTLLQPFLRPEFMDFFFFFKNVYCIYFRIKLHTQSLKFGCFLYSFLGFFFDIFFNVWKSKRGNAISQFQIHGSSHWYTVCGIFWQKTTKFLRIVI